jgi:hypothetical protein
MSLNDIGLQSVPSMSLTSYGISSNKPLRYVFDDPIVLQFQNITVVFITEGLRPNTNSLMYFDMTSAQKNAFLTLCSSVNLQPCLEPHVCMRCNASLIPTELRKTGSSQSSTLSTNVNVGVLWSGFVQQKTLIPNFDATYVSMI